MHGSQAFGKWMQRHAAAPRVVVAALGGFYWSREGRESCEAAFGFLAEQKNRRVVGGIVGCGVCES